MKLKISRPDGVVLDIEAEVQEIIQLLPGVLPITGPALGSFGYPWFFRNDMCPKGGTHDYVSPWNGVVPPPCRKCGKGGYDDLATIGVSVGGGGYNPK